MTRRKLMKFLNNLKKKKKNSGLDSAMQREKALVKDDWPGKKYTYVSNSFMNKNSFIYNCILYRWKY